MLATPSRGQMVRDIITSVRLRILTRHLLTKFRGAENRVKNCNRRIQNAMSKTTWTKTKFVLTTMIVARIQRAASVVALHGMKNTCVVRQRRSVNPGGIVGVWSGAVLLCVNLPVRADNSVEGRLQRHSVRVVAVPVAPSSSV
jgi:hypothetical protein